MSKKQIHIDNFFKNALEGIEGPASDADWSAIEGKLNAQPKRRKAFWWWIAIPMLVLMVGLAYLKLDKKPKNHIQPNANKIEVPNFKEHPNTPDEKRIINDPPIEPGSKSKVKQAKDKVELMSSIGTTENQEKDLKDDEKGSQEKHEQKAVVLVEKQSDNKPNQPENQRNEEIANEANEEHPIAINEEKKENVEATVPLAADTLKTLRKPIAEWRLKLQASPISSFRNISTTGANPDYLLARQGDQSMAFLNAGLHLERTKNNFGFSAGVEKSSFGYKGTYNVTRNIYDSIPVLNTQGQVIGYFRLNYRDSNYISQFSNQITYASVPLWANTNVRLNANINLKLGLGIQFGRMIQAKGIDMNLSTLAFEEIKNKLNKNALCAGMNLGVEYKLNPKWTLSAEGLYQRNLLSVYSPTNPVKMYPFVAGGNICIGYLLQTKK